MALSNFSLHSAFLRSAERFGDRSALEVEGRISTYSELRALAESIAATLLVHDDPNASPQLTAVFGYRSVVAFAGVLGALARGHGYVPLNRTFPPERTAVMLERSGCRAVIVDEGSASQLEIVLRDIHRPLVLLFPGVDDVRPFIERWPQHRVLGRPDVSQFSKPLPPVSVISDSVAYLLFTSGSTGQPKGVAVSHRNVRSYLDFVVPRYGITPEDRCSQTFDMTFDLSVHDMFVTWECGACLCCPTQKGMIKPGSFIKDSRISVWFSVPSTAVFMKRLGMLKPGMYPGLRLSLFCGEALPMEVAKEWGEAAPNSVIENIYGPTELTIACTAYRWDRKESPGDCEMGLVPIGEPFDGIDAILVDEGLREVPEGVAGELLMAGPQVTLGYWQDAEKTAHAFVVPPGKSKVYYRTGDRVRRPAPVKPLVYLGRVDNQVKILGHRVELGEIEAVIREESGLDGVVAVGWPRTPAGAGGVEVFLQAEEPSGADLKERVDRRLPVYMAPRKYHYVAAFPLNSNGKYDRNALVKRLEQNQ